MSGRNEHFENFVLFLIVGGLLAAGILYVLFFFWPYLIFYALPLVIGSAVVGGILRMATVPYEGGNGFAYYKALAIAYPMMLCFVAVVFFAGSERAIVMNASNNITGTYLDWPEVNKVFNQKRSQTYAGSPFDSLKIKAKQTVVYDRQELGWIALWCLFLGGPVFFWFLTRRDQQNDENVVQKMVLEKTKYERDRINEKEANLNAIIAGRLTKYQEKVASLERQKAELFAENQVLKAKVEFSPHIPKPSETQKTGGVLDSDVL